MVLSSQSRLLVALCFTVLVLAGALTIGSLTGWFSPVFTEPMPARLQVSQIQYIVASFFSLVLTLSGSFDNFTIYFLQCFPHF